MGKAVWWPKLCEPQDWVCWGAGIRVHTPFPGLCLLTRFVTVERKRHIYLGFRKGGSPHGTVPIRWPWSVYLASPYGQTLLSDKAASKPSPVPRFCESKNRLACAATCLYVPHINVRFAKQFSLLLVFPLCSLSTIHLKDSFSGCPRNCSFRTWLGGVYNALGFSLLLDNVKATGHLPFVYYPPALCAFCVLMPSVF